MCNSNSGVSSHMSNMYPNTCPKYSNINKLENAVLFLKKCAMNSNMVHKHSACLLRGDKIVAVGVNKYLGINGGKIKMSVHAELDAIRYNRYLKGMDILIIRVGKTTLQNSRPCNSCIDKLRQRGVRRAYYSNSNGDIVYELIDDMPKIHCSSGNAFRLGYKSINNEWSGSITNRCNTHISIKTNN